jgi:hypothetical protein
MKEDVKKDKVSILYKSPGRDRYCIKVGTATWFEQTRGDIKRFIKGRSV